MVWRVVRRPQCRRRRSPSSLSAPPRVHFSPPSSSPIAMANAPPTPVPTIDGGNAMGSSSTNSPVTSWNKRWTERISSEDPDGSSTVREVVFIAASSSPSTPLDPLCGSSSRREENNNSPSLLFLVFPISLPRGENIVEPVEAKEEVWWTHTSPPSRLARGSPPPPPRAAAASSTRPQRRRRPTPSLRRPSSSPSSAFPLSSRFRDPMLVWEDDLPTTMDGWSWRDHVGIPPSPSFPLDASAVVGLLPRSAAAWLVGRSPSCSVVDWRNGSVRVRSVPPASTALSPRPIAATHPTPSLAFPPSSGENSLGIGRGSGEGIPDVPSRPSSVGPNGGGTGLPGVDGANANGGPLSPRGDKIPPSTPNEDRGRGTGTATDDDSTPPAMAREGEERK